MSINFKYFSVLVLCIFLVVGTGCKKKHLRTVGALIVAGVAAKIIYDMVIDYRSEQTRNDKQVVNKYKEQHKELPSNPQLLSYQSTIKPGAVVNPGKKISVQSSLEVVRGKKSNELNIQEKITIYDNEDPDKVLKSLVKQVNSKTNKCGAFSNEFTFTLPKGMPQGVYPIKTEVLVDGVAYETTENQMQLVVNREQQNMLIALN
ncbi:hypothetical protein [Pleionea sediminis]|uniref:hypothetical protein n=1 Tax=Pleionea sediminis TaxID=2569479 RepID=UPI001186AA86|nr:hypothetical protein [Pleionea sediminis]